MRATYDASTGALPEEASPPWTLTADDGSFVEVATVGGEPALHVIDDGLPADAEGLCQPTVTTGGIGYTLEEPSLASANVYGIEARVLLLDGCAQSGASMKQTATFGVVDGDRVAAVTTFLFGGRPAVRFFVVPPPPGTFVLPPLELDPFVYHTLTLRTVRGEHVDLFVDGATTPAMTIAYDGLPTVGEAQSKLPPETVPPAGGAFSFHSDRMDLAWSLVNVLSCTATPLQIAMGAIEQTATQVTAELPASRATTLNKKLVGNGSATFHLDRAQQFLDAGNVCAAVVKHDAALGKIEGATVQLGGWPACPRGANCMSPDAQANITTLLAVDRMLVETAKISACTLSPLCTGCPPPPSITGLERNDGLLGDARVETLCALADQPISAMELRCLDGGPSTVVATVTMPTAAGHIACAHAIALPAACDWHARPYSLVVTPRGLTGLLGDATTLRRAIRVRDANDFDGKVDQVCIDSTGSLTSLSYSVSEDDVILFENVLDPFDGNETSTVEGTTTCFVDVPLHSSPGPGTDQGAFVSWRVAELVAGGVWGDLNRSFLWNMLHDVRARFLVACDQEVAEANALCGGEGGPGAAGAFLFSQHDQPAFRAEIDTFAREQDLTVDFFAVWDDASACGDIACERFMSLDTGAAICPRCACLGDANCPADLECPPGSGGCLLFGTTEVNCCFDEDASLFPPGPCPITATVSIPVGSATVGPSAEVLLQTCIGTVSDDPSPLCTGEGDIETGWGLKDSAVCALDPSVQVYNVVAVVPFPEGAPATGADFDVSDLVDIVDKTPTPFVGTGFSYGPMDGVWDECGIQFRATTEPSGVFPVFSTSVPEVCFAPGSQTSEACFPVWVMLAESLGDCVADEDVPAWPFHCERIAYFVMPEDFFDDPDTPGVFDPRAGFIQSPEGLSPSPPLIFVQPAIELAWVAEIAHVLMRGAHIDDSACLADFPDQEELCSGSQFARNILCGNGGEQFGEVAFRTFGETSCEVVDQCERARAFAPLIYQDLN